MLLSVFQAPVRNFALAVKAVAEKEDKLSLSKIQQQKLTIIWRFNHE